MRVAVIGAGSIGSRHVGNLLSMGCDVTVCEPYEDSRARAKARFDDARVTGIRVTQEEEFDAWVIASPMNTHLSWAANAVSRGIPFLLEKPVGCLDELSDWRRLGTAAKNLTTQVGYQLRFHPALRFMREQWKDQATSASFFCNVNMNTWPGKTYGPWLLECSHEIDAALWCGAPTNVTEAYYLNDTFCDFYLGQWFVGIDASADKYYRSWRMRNHDAFCCLDWHSTESLGTLMYYDEMLHFIECVRENRQTDVPLSEGVKVLEVCAAVEEVARKAA